MAEPTPALQPTYAARPAPLQGAAPSRTWRRLWRAARWPVVGGIWALGLILAYIGFARHPDPLGTGGGSALSPLDYLYLTLQLIPMNSGAVPPPLPWELAVARLLVPAVAAYTALQALALLFVEQLQTFRLRRIRNHIVICGLGRKGFLLARAFLERGHRVVVVERDAENDFLKPCRDLGALTVVGDAADRGALAAAGVGRARCLIAVGGEDGDNADVAVHARDLVAARDGAPLTCLVHIVDPQLCELLRERELLAEDAGNFRLEFFNTFDMGARAVLEEHPPFGKLRPGDHPHLLLLGLGSMGRSLAVRAARQWRDNGGGGGDRLRITVVDREADRKVDNLLLRYPNLSGVCQLIPAQMDVSWPEFHRMEYLAGGDVTAIYVCFDDDSLGLTAALTLLQRLRGRRVPIVLRSSSGAGLTALLQRAPAGGAPPGAFADLHAFPLLERTCQPELLLGGTHEILARAGHEEYLRAQAALGQTRETNPALVRWDELPEELRESNRRQADHIGVKLCAVGCDVAPLTDWDAELFEFETHEVELMARMEHDRFVAERIGDGWRYAPGPKDLAKKTSPTLLPWDDERLTEPEREKDRNAVRGLPRFLARAGLQIVRARPQPC